MQNSIVAEDNFFLRLGTIFTNEQKVTQRILSMQKRLNVVTFVAYYDEHVLHHSQKIVLANS
jgi:hypothetical protein